MSEKDLIEAYQEESVLRHGRTMTSSEMARQFSLHPLETRISLLKTLTRENISSEHAGRRWEFEGALKRTHDRLRRAGR